ncbi:fibronectin type III domain-containing protein [Virgibacillus sp. W0181]|uniref:fibronectin type III domain-containing protein n=1 Tax=Virgibacillus sp. W0181 TaxID=3391581 RepID=UPI003F474854
MNNHFFNKLTSILLIFLLIFVDAAPLLSAVQASAEEGQNSPWPADAKVELVEAGETNLTVKWPAAEDGVNLLSYRVTALDESGEVVAEETLFEEENLVREAVLTDLIPRTNYTIEVVIIDYNESHVGPPLIKQNIQTLADNEAPVWPENAALDVTETGQDFIVASWPDAEDNAGIAAYEWEVSQEGTIVDSGEVTDTNVRVENLQAGASYTFQVVAKDSSRNLSDALKNEGIKTAAVPGVPEWPSDAEIIVADVGPDFINIQWPDLEWIDGHKDFHWELLQDGVKIKDGTANYVVFGSDAKGGTTIEQLDPRTTYTFRVIAEDHSGGESRALEGSVTTAHYPPKWPSNSELIIDDKGSNFIEVSWPEVENSDNNTDNLKYELNIRTEYNSQKTIVLPAEEQSYRFEGLAWNTKYTIQVVAVSTENNIEQKSNPLKESVETADDTDETKEITTQLLHNTNIDPTKVAKAINARVSSDGKYIVFQSDAADVTDQSEEGKSAIYRVNTETGDIQMVSVDDGGNALNNCGFTEIYGDSGRENLSGSVYPDVSADGRYVLFLSNCESLAEEGKVSDFNVFVRDMKQGVTQQVNRFSTGEVVKDGNTIGVKTAPVISDDGNHVLFSSTRNNVVEGSNDDWIDNLYVRDLMMNTTVQISEATKGSSLDRYAIRSVYDISADGRFITYDARDSDRSRDVFSIYLYDRDVNGNGIYDEAGDTSRTNIVNEMIAKEDLDESGFGFNFSTHDQFTSPTISADGNKIAFRWYRWKRGGIILYDRTEKSYQKLIDHLDSQDMRTSRISSVELSPDGKYLLLNTKEPFLPSDTGWDSDIYVMDTQKHTMNHISLNTDGSEGDGDSTNPSISGDGKFVVYQSNATNLVDNPPSQVGNYLYSTSLSTSVDASVPTWPSNAQLVSEEIGKSFVRLSWSAAQHSQGIKNYRIYAMDENTSTNDGVDLGGINLGGMNLLGSFEKDPIIGDEEGTITDPIEFPEQRELLAEVSGLTLSHTVTGLEAGKTYTFAVEAVNASGVETDDGPTVLATTEKAGGTEASLSATAHPGGTIDLIWDGVSDEDVTGYRIHRTGPEGNVTKIDVEGTKKHSYTDEDLAAGSDYTYQIFTIDKNDAEQAYSVETTVTTPDLFLDKVNWDAITATYSELILPDHDFTITATGEPHRKVTATIQYKTYMTADGSLAGEMHEESTEVTLKEASEQPGTYEGAFPIDTGVAEITDVEVTITDELGHTVSQPLQSLPITMASLLDVSVTVSKDISDEFSDIRLLVKSDKEGESSKVFIGNGTYVFTNLVPSKDYTITLLGDKDGHTQVLDKIESVQIREGSGNEWDIEPELLPTSIDINVTDPDGDAYKYKRVTMYFVQDGREIGSKRLDKDGNTDTWSLGNRSTKEDIDVRIVVEASEPYILEKEKVFAIEAGSNDLQITMDKAPSGLLSGELLGVEDTDSIKEVKVRITGIDNYLNKVESVNNDGSFGPIELPTGDYVVTTRLDNTIEFEEKNITIKENEDLNISISAHYLPQLNLHVVDAEGNDYKSKKVTMYTHPEGQYVGTEYLNRKGKIDSWYLNKMDPGEKQKYRLVVDGDRPFFHKKEEIIEVEKMVNNKQLTMDTIPLGQLTGQVLNKEKNEPINGARLQLMDVHSDWNKEIKVDNEGRFGSMDLPAGDYVITGNLDNSIVFEKRDITITGNETVDMTIDADYLQLYTIRIGEIKSRSIGEDWTTVSGIDREMAWGYDFSVKIDGDNYNVSKKAGRHTYPIIVWAKEGDDLEACINPRGDRQRHCETETLGSTTDLDVDFTIDQQPNSLITGNVKLANDLLAKKVRVKLKQNGKHISSSQEKNFEIPVENSGDYELSITAYDHAWGSGGTTIPVHVQDGIKTDLGTIVINTEGIFKGRLVSFHALESLTNKGEMVTFRLGYGRPAQSIDDAVLLLDIPQGTELVPGNVSHDGKAIEPVVKDKVLEIPLDKDKETIRYSVQVDDDFDQDLVTADARIRYTVDGEQKEEVLGTASVQVGAVTINTPTEVDSPTIVTHGQAPPNSLVQVMDGHRVLATTQASSAGYWKAEVILSSDHSRSWHTLQAIVDDQEKTIFSSSVDVLYDQEQPKLEEVWIRQDFNNRDEWNGSFFPTSLINSMKEFPEYTKIDVRNGVPRVPMTGIVGVPIEVKLKFSQPDQVSNVQVWFDGDNTNEKTIATREDGDMYYARVETFRNGTWDFGDLYVDYDTPDKYPKWADSIQVEESSVEVSQVKQDETEEDSNSGFTGFIRSMFTSNQSESELHISTKNKYTIADWDNATISIDADFITGKTLESSGTDNGTNPGGGYDFGDQIGDGDYDVEWIASGGTSLANVNTTIPLDDFIAADRFAPWWDDDAELVASEIEASSLTLGWSPAMDDLWAETYKIYQDNAEIATISASELTYNVTGLTSGETYTFQVEAIDPAGKRTKGPEIEIVMGETVGLSKELFQQFNTLAHSMEHEISKQFRTKAHAVSSAAVQAGIKVVGHGLTVTDVIGWEQGRGGMFSDMENIEDMLDGLGGSSCPSKGKAKVAKAMKNAKTSVIADMTLNTAGLAVGLGATATGVGAPAGAAIAVATLAGGAMSGFIKEQQLDAAREAYDEYMAQNPECKEEKEEKEKEEKEEEDEEREDEEKEPRVKPAWKLDPSGYVYEVHEGNRVQGVTTTVLFREGPEDDWEVWDAEWWGEVNPQTTDVFGQYGWDVPKGQWQVVYEKDGYETTYSDVLDVPPPHFDVNVPITTTQAPEVGRVSSYIGGGNDEEDQGIEIQFDQYIKTDTISNSAYRILNTEDGSQVTGEMTFVDSVTDLDGNKVTDTLRFIPDKDMVLGGEFEVILRSLIKNYAGISMEDEYSTTVTVEAAPKIDKVHALRDRTVAVGTEKGAIDLPKEILVTLSDDRTEVVDVAWDSGIPPYDKDEAGQYIFTGTLTMPSGIANPDGIQASIAVTVEAPNVVDDNENPGDGGEEPEDGTNPDPGDGADPDPGDEGEGSEDGANPDSSDPSDGINKVVAPGETVDVSAGHIIQIKGTENVITMPKDLPEGTKITVKLLGDKLENLDGFILAGLGIEVNVQFPSSYKGETEHFTLTMNYDNETYSADQVDIYYFNEDTKEWEEQNGDVNEEKGVITLKVPHFSKYAVLAKVNNDKEGSQGNEDTANPKNPGQDDGSGKEDESPGDVNTDSNSDGKSPALDDANQDKDGDKLPGTATNIFNWIVLGVFLLLVGVILIIRKRKNDRKA